MALSACIDDRTNIACFGLRALGLFARARTDDPLAKHPLRRGVLPGQTEALQQFRFRQAGDLESFHRIRLSGHDGDGLRFNLELLGQEIDQALIGLALFRRGSDLDLERFIQQPRERGPTTARDDLDREGKALGRVMDGQRAQGFNWHSN